VLFEESAVEKPLDDADQSFDLTRGCRVHSSTLARSAVRD
jgi:hypothetical protein